MIAIHLNHRQISDSRIRAPFKDSWKRDVLRVKGGVTDYCVIGEIGVQALRQPPLAGQASQAGAGWVRN